MTAGRTAKRCRMLIASALALLAFTGAQPASAALPEFKPPFPNAFAATSNAVKLQTVGGVVVSCEAGGASGAVSTSKSLEITLRFTSCSSNVLPASSCQTGGKAEGEIVSRPLVGRLGYLREEPVVVGLDLVPAAEGPLLRFFCGEDLGAEVWGSLIGRAGPVDRYSRHLRVRFAENGGRQARKALLGGEIDVPLMTFAGGELEPAGLAETDALTLSASTGITA